MLCAWTSWEESMQQTTSRKEFIRIHEIQGRVLAELTDLLQEFETRVPLPRQSLNGNEPGYAYEERSPQQALVLLLARMMSALYAERLLIATGLTEDAGLSAGIVEGALLCISSLAHATNRGDAPVLAEELTAGVWQGNYVTPPPRADAASVMDMYGAPGPRFHITGRVGSRAWTEAHARLQGHIEAAIASVALCGIAFGHPGIKRYADDCRAAYLAELAPPGNLAPSDARTINGGCAETT
jgi:hypothetical protein